MLLYLWVVRLVVTGGSLTRRPKWSFHCLLVEVPWQINEYLNHLCTVRLLAPKQAAYFIKGFKPPYHNWQTVISLDWASGFVSKKGYKWDSNPWLYQLETNPVFEVVAMLESCRMALDLVALCYSKHSRSLVYNIAYCLPSFASFFDWQLYMLLATVIGDDDKCLEKSYS